jgi:hypothetical protein
MTAAHPPESTPRMNMRFTSVDGNHLDLDALGASRRDPVATDPRRGAARCRGETDGLVVTAW